jgi:hypothetical protein
LQQTNSVTVTRNGSDKIGGVNANVALILQKVNLVFLVYVDATQGWKHVQWIQLLM